jgi:hypothetical protein
MVKLLSLLMLVALPLHAQKVVSNPKEIKAIITKPDVVNMLTYSGVQICGFARLSDNKVYGATFDDGTRTFDIPYCSANYSVWFTKAERTKQTTTAVYSDSFGGIVADPLVIKRKNIMRR